MAARKKRGPGGKRKGAGRPRTARGMDARIVAVRFTRAEYDAIAEAVATENAEAIADPDATPEDKVPATVSSWIRDHALDPIGLADFETRDGD